MDEYHWSSHSVYLGSQTLSWLTTDSILAHFGNDKFDAIFKYQHFMRSEIDKSVQNLLSKGNNKKYDVLGEDNFLQQLLATDIMPKKFKVQLNDLVKLVCEYYSIKESDLESNSRLRINSKLRTIIAVLAKEMNIASLTGVAHYFNRDVTGLSRSINKFSDALEIPDALRIIINKSICQT